jgi:hypothetical protein
MWERLISSVVRGDYYVEEFNIISPLTTDDSIKSYHTLMMISQIPSFNPTRFTILIYWPPV